MLDRVNLSGGKGLVAVVVGGGVYVVVCACCTG